MDWPLLYVSAADGHVYALNAHTGSPRWIYSTHGEIQGTLAVTDGLVYVGANGAGVYGLKA